MKSYNLLMDRMRCNSTTFVDQLDVGTATQNILFYALIIGMAFVIIAQFSTLKARKKD
ncbi:hypothetical protein ABIB62_002998 [Mucilaginibacter sp. UYP25]|uniref:hypothetical protein n=1 Tax=unclassified Mucilaginibacter TaxID=2617802 RepID=UPI003391A163